eukprot:jgi/Ulvmu1/8483/UM044_0016.1
MLESIRTSTPAVGRAGYSTARLASAFNVAHSRCARLVKAAAEGDRVWPDPNNPEITPVTGYEDQMGNDGGSGGGGSGGSGGSDGEDEEGSRLPLATVLLAILLLVGGFKGYKESGSNKSAIAGCGSGALLLLSASLMGSSTMSALGFCLACGTTLVLLVVMTKRYAQTKKFMPAGLIASLSTLYSILYLTSGRMA